MNNIVITLDQGTRYSKLRSFRDFIKDNFSSVVVACYTPKVDKTKVQNGLLTIPASQRVADIRFNILRPRVFKLLGSVVYIDLECAHCDDFQAWLTTDQKLPIMSNGFLYLPKSCVPAYKELYDWVASTNTKETPTDFWKFVEREVCIPQF